MTDDDARSVTGPLNGWRAIATYLGRNQSTVKRWANEAGLPVHRPKGSAARKGVPVYAFASELDAWLRGHQLDRLPPGAAENPEHDPLADAPAQGDEGGVETAAASTVRETGGKAVSRRAAVLAGLGVSLCLVAGAGLWWGGTARVEREVSGNALNLYNQGLFHLNLRTSEGIGRAMRLFGDALALEPDFTDAKAALAQSYNLAAQYGVLPPQEAYPLAVTTAREALALAPDHAAGLAALAFATFYWLRDFPAAYDLFEHALRIDPDNADVHHWYALAIMHDRRFDIAVREIEAAQRLSPTSPSVLANKALILHHAGRTAEALAILEPLAETQPRLLSPVSYLATIYLDMGRDADFVAAYSRAAELLGAPGPIEIADAAESGLALGGRTGMLEAMLEVQDRLFEAGHEPAFKLAVTAAYLGRTDLALDYLESAIERDEPGVLGVKLELPVRVLRGAPRYGELVARMNFSAV